MAKFSRQSGFPHCSFCGRSRDKVRRLVAWPGAYICDECIELCTEIVYAGAAEVSSEAIAAKGPLPDWKVILRATPIQLNSARSSVSWRRSRDNSLRWRMTWMASARAESIRTGLGFVRPDLR